MDWILTRHVPSPAWVTRTQVTRTDDIDGSTDDVVTCAFGLGDTQFEIDLNEAHLEELENALAKFIQFARPVSGGLSARKRRQGAPTSNQACGIDRAACAMIAASRASVFASPGCRSAIRRIANPGRYPTSTPSSRATASGNAPIVAG